MAYTASDKILGQAVINQFIIAYRNENGIDINQTEFLQKAGLKYSEDQYLKILGAAFDTGLQRDYVELRSRMENLVIQTKGGYPSTGDLISRMRDETSTYSIIKEALSQAASDINKGVTTFSENSLFLVSTLNKAFPLLILGGIAYFIYVNRERFKV